MCLYIRIKCVHTIILFIRMGDSQSCTSKGCLYDSNFLHPGVHTSNGLSYENCSIMRSIRLSFSHHILLVAIDNIVVRTMGVLTGQPLEGIVWPQCHRHCVALLNECEFSGQIEGVVLVLAHQGSSCNGAFAHNLQPRPPYNHLGRTTRVHGVNEQVCDRGVSYGRTRIVTPHRFIVINTDVGVVVLVVNLGCFRAESVSTVLHSIVALHSHKNIIV
jgi:hypothetical protein